MKINCNFIPFIMEEAKVNDNSHCVKKFGAKNPVPNPRSGHRIVYYNKNIYCIGGYNPSLTTEDYDDPDWQETCPLFQEVWKFNIYFNCWSRMKVSGEMPIELASHSATIYKSHLLVFGGTATPFGETSSNDVHICSIKSGEWKKLCTTGRLPRPMYGQAMCRKDDKLFIVGGTTGYNYFLDVHILDLEELNWKLYVPSLTRSLVSPESRYRHEIIEHEGRLYVFGGGTSGNSYPLDRLPTFLIEEKIWRITETRPDPRTKLFPKSRKCHILVKYKNCVYIQGGMAKPKNLSDFWQFNLNTMTWRRIPINTEQPIYFHSAAVTEEGCIYIYGGVWNDPRTRTNKVFKMYIDVPSLLTMAWEAVLKSNPKLPSLKKSQMLEFGIPPTIVQWL